MNDEKQIKHNWQQRGFTFGIWDDPPGQVWKDFIHDVDELFMLADGDVELTLSGETLHPHVGEAILIPAGAYHTVENIGSTTSHWYYGYKKTA